MWLCNHTVNFLLARDHHHRLKFAPLQGETASKFVPEGVRRNLKSLVLFEPAKCISETAAVVRILWLLGESGHCSERSSGSSLSHCEISVTTCSRCCVTASLETRRLPLTNPFRTSCVSRLTPARASGRVGAAGGGGVRKFIRHTVFSFLTAKSEAVYGRFADRNDQRPLPGLLRSPDLPSSAGGGVTTPPAPAGGSAQPGEGLRKLVKPSLSSNPYFDL